MSFIAGFLIGCVIAGLATYAYVIRKIDSSGVEDDGWWTVCGVWTLSKERWSLHVQASDARQAEDLAQHEAKFDLGKELWVTGVFKGKLDNADKYATFIDPDVQETDWLNHGNENPL